MLRYMTVCPLIAAGLVLACLFPTVSTGAVWVSDYGDESDDDMAVAAAMDGNGFIYILSNCDGETQVFKVDPADGFLVYEECWEADGELHAD